MLPIRTTTKCILCWNMHAMVRSFAWVEVTLPNGRKKEVGLCFKHCTRHTEKYPNGILDPEFGEWKKTPFGFMPIRDELYRPWCDDMSLITGIGGKIPKWY